jgi:hypothetical protein
LFSGIHDFQGRPLLFTGALNILRNLSPLGGATVGMRGFDEWPFCGHHPRRAPR